MSQFKFKVGDIVEVIDDSGNPEAVMGERCTVVVPLNADECTRVQKSNGHIYNMYPHRFKLVDNQVKESDKDKNKMSKFYRVIKDLPDFEAGAILEDSGNGYKPISDLWNTPAYDEAVKNNVGGKSKYIVEGAPDWFERVYEVSVLGKAKYLAKSDARLAHEELHKPKK